ncbi:MAG: cache domain-containing protein [Synechococcaceae cyanobacterium]|nr:cache domain-containing protein [Synechococcaceae cyanobacterium]
MGVAPIHRRAALALAAAMLVVAPPAGARPPRSVEVRPAAMERARETYEFPENRELVQMVEAAARQVATRGEAVFPEFRVKGGRWFQGDRYIFVLDVSGNSYVYPPDPASEGVNFLGFEDLGGKPFGRMFVERATDADRRGWVHYQWRRPELTDRRPVWKSTYLTTVKAPSGKEYLVAGGIYEGRMEKAFVVEEVEAAAALLERRGRAGFDQLRDRRSRFFFHDTYVFVDTPDGVEVVNPAFPEVQGRNLLELRDVQGRPMVRDYIRLALEQGSGWTTYLWPRPESPGLPARKFTYVRKVVLPDGETLIVGSGLYEANRTP